jgi:2-iminoacetate synthase ThiH
VKSQKNNYTKFEHLRDSGLSPKEVSSIAVKDDLDFVDNLHMLRNVFGLDLMQAKEAWIRAKGIANSLDEYQEKLIPEIEEAMSELEKERE